MSVDAARDLTALAGPRVAHVTDAGNVAAILDRGLFPAETLALEAGIDPDTICLRPDRLRVGAARLGHQRPILRGLAAANRIVDGFDAHLWAAQLDRRVFFWPERRLQRFRRALSEGGDTSTLWFDTTRLAGALADRIELSPINSGNFTQGGAQARRGAWLYVPLSAGAEAFRTNRRSRGLTRSRDTLAELSVTGPIAPDILHTCLLGIDTAD